MKNTICVLALLATILLTVPTQVSIIATTGTWNGSASVAGFGEFNSATYGQTFLVGSDNSLDSFSFFVNDFVNPDHVDFAAYVMEWDGAKASGPILYTSSMTTTTNNGGSDGFEQFTFSTGGLSLSSGNTYIAFMSASNFFDGNQGTSSVGYLRADVYSDGGFFFLNNGNDSSQWTTNNWETFIGNGVQDLAFIANFSGGGAVPEPTTALIWSAGIGLALTIRRRKKRA